MLERPAGQVRTVAEGLFFARPDALPRGPHALSRERVEAAQRERLMRAMTELIAHGGYEAVRIGDVTARAGVSRAAFYACFGDKLGCASGAYDRWVEVTLRRVADALDPARPITAGVSDALIAFLSLLQSDLVVARAFLVEAEAIGMQLRRRRRESMQAFADLLAGVHDLRRALEPSAAGVPPTVFLGVVYAVRQLAADRLESWEDDPDLLALVPDVSSAIVRMFAV